MQLDFFPSRALTFYLAKLFVVRILAVLVMLVLILQMLDLLSASGDILKYEGNGQGELLRYVSLRTPQLIARFIPYSVLLATIITLATLNQNSEVIAMKAAGMSAHQVLAPLLLVAGIVSAANFTFNETVVVGGNATLKAWKANDYGPVSKESGVRSNVYVTDGADILSAATMSGSGSNTKLGNVTWYNRDPRGMITQQMRASTATYAAPGWKMQDVTVFTVETARTEQRPTVVVAAGLTPDQLAIDSIDPEIMSFGELSSAIEALKAAGRRTGELEAKWWHKMSGPLSAFLMPLLGAVAAFGLARSGQLFLRAVIGMALGFAYFVVDNAALAMGSFGGYPPLLAAWSPFLLFALIGETVLIRTEE